MRKVGKRMERYKLQVVANRLFQTKQGAVAVDARRFFVAETKKGIKKEEPPVSVLQELTKLTVRNPS